MDFNDYQKLAARTMAPESVDNPPGKQIAVYGLGLAGESGEVIEIIKKGVGHGQAIDVDKVKKELGDVLWYLSAIASHFDLTLEEVAQTNVNKLQTRYPEGFSPQASAARKDTLVDQVIQKMTDPKEGTVFDAVAKAPPEDQVKAAEDYLDRLLPKATTNVTSPQYGGPSNAAFKLMQAVKKQSGKMPPERPLERVTDPTEPFKDAIGAAFQRGIFAGAETAVRPTQATMEELLASGMEDQLHAQGLYLEACRRFAKIQVAASSMKKPEGSN